VSGLSLFTVKDCFRLGANPPRPHGQRTRTVQSGHSSRTSKALKSSAILPKHQHGVAWAFDFLFEASDRALINLLTLRGPDIAAHDGSEPSSPCHQHDRHVMIGTVLQCTSSAMEYKYPLETSVQRFRVSSSSTSDFVFNPRLYQSCFAQSYSRPFWVSLQQALSLLPPLHLLLSSAVRTAVASLLPSRPASLPGPTR